jgi:hypothetical protein
LFRAAFVSRTCTLWMLHFQVCGLLPASHTISVFSRVFSEVFFRVFVSGGDLFSMNIHVFCFTYLFGFYYSKYVQIIFLSGLRNRTLLQFPRHNFRS